MFTMPPRKKTTPPPPERSVLRVSLDAARRFLERKVSEGEAFIAAAITDEAQLRQVRADRARWRDMVRTWLERNLGGEAAIEFQHATNHVSFGSAGLLKDVEFFRQDVSEETNKIKSIIDRLELWQDESPTTPDPAGSSPDESAPVFIVHGHDVDRAEVVARVVERNTGREAIILHEQPDAGRTIIEKFEDHGAAAVYAVVLLTPDDHGGPIDGESMPRGRQNVVFEMGYFFGSIGRARVCVLHDPSVELPSDVHGLLYVPFDPAGAWKAKLLTEMAHAGITSPPP